MKTSDIWWLVLILVLAVVIIIAFPTRRPPRWPKPSTEQPRYVLYLGTLNDALDWAKLNGYPKGIVIPLARANAQLWGLRGPIAIVGDPGFIGTLPTRERVLALEAVDRVGAINLVTMSEQGGDDVR